MVGANGTIETPQATKSYGGAANITGDKQRSGTTNTHTSSPTFGEDIDSDQQDSRTGFRRLPDTDQLNSYLAYQKKQGNIAVQTKAGNEIRELTRTHIYPSCKFANNESYFAYVPVRNPEDPLHGCFFRIIRQNCTNIGADQGAWWETMKCEVKTALSKRRGSATSALKKAVVGE